MKQIISTPNAPAAIGTYSQAVKFGDTTYLSGQIPLDPASMQLVAGFENQVRRVFDNLQAVCEAAGGSLNDLVKINVYLINLANFAMSTKSWRAISISLIRRVLPSAFPRCRAAQRWRLKA